jgi:glycosyltransferase involved in cell wall biosynthesis
MSRRGSLHHVDFDFVYLGNNHEANLETVRWLLREVFPLANARVRERVRFVGKIDRLLEGHEPLLFKRYEHLFLGEISSVLDFYTAARVILAPARAGTGTSIKLIEALCAGKPIVATSLALRGLPRGEMLGAGIHVHDAACDIAGVMNRLSDAGSQAPAEGPGNASLYDRLFSNARYFAALDDAIDRQENDGCPSACVAGGRHGTWAGNLP